MEFNLNPILNRIKIKKLSLSLLLSLSVTGCGSDSDEDTNRQLVYSQAFAPSELCEFGGIRINTGTDFNNNGVLEESEIQSSSYNCNPNASSTIVAQSMSFQAVENEPLSGQLLVSENQPTITYHVSQRPLKGSLALNEDGSFIYTANSGAIGNDVFTYYISHDGLFSNTAIIDISISAQNNAPVAQASNFSIYNSLALQTQLIATDIDSQNLTYTLQGAAVSGTAVISESGLLTYNANDNYVGEESLTYNVSDGEKSDTAEVTITVIETFLQVSSSTIQYSVEAGIKQQQQTTIINMGDEPISMSIQSSPLWYSVIADGISVPANSQADLVFDIDSTQLSAGSYQGEVTFVTSEPGAPTLSQNVTLDVTADVTPPAQITDLATDGGLTFNQAKLKWTAVADSGTRGLPVAAFEIRYSTSLITEATWETATLLALSQDPSEAETTEHVTATGLNPDTLYYFAIKSIDRNNLIATISNVISFTTLLPPGPIVESSLDVSLKEAEQKTVDLVLNNAGQSPLIYTTQLAVNSQPSLAKLSSLKTIAKPALLKASSLGDNNGNIIIKFKDNQGATQSLTPLMSQYQLQEQKSINSLNLKVVRPQQSDPEAYVKLINHLNSLPEVAYAEPDYKVQALFVPNDALFDQQWALNNSGQTGGSIDADIDGAEAWDLYKDGSNVIVAVIDTGVKYDHQDLAGNAWINTNEIANNGIDDDNNGFIDDVYGYDFVNLDGDPMDDNGHGTHCAGILGAEGDNGIGISGAAHSAQIMGLKFLGASGGGSTSAAIDSIMYAVDNGATILSNSWGGGGFSQALFDAISYANDHDVLFIAAAGNDSRNNDNSPSYPANYDLPNVISVASTDHSDQLSYFSNYGMTVHLAAPGSNILSTYYDGGYASLSGTSMATPYVSGAAVLLRSNFPNLSALETKEILLNTVDELDQLNGILATGGRLNVIAALTEANTSNYINIDSGASGEILPGGSATIQITIDATNKLAGLYESQLSILTNAPEFENIPVALNVTVLFDETPPDSVNDLQINTSNSSNVSLQWSNTGDDGLQDRATALTFAYSTLPITLENWDVATLVDGPIPTDSGSIQEFTINQLQPTTLYYFAMRVMDNSGQYSALSNVVSVTTPLPAILEITPGVIPTVTLNKGESSSTTLTLENKGGDTLEYTAQLTEQAEEEPEHLQRLSVLHAKDQQDFRIGIAPQSSGGPDTFGYNWSDSDEDQVTYDWTDISSIGTSLSFGDDTVSTALDLGFSFNFYGTDYTQVYVSSNGFLTFQNVHSGCCTGQPLPSQDEINNLIAWAWKDLHPQQGSVHYVVNENEFIVQFSNYGEYAANGQVTAQVILSSNGTIKLQYQSFTNGFNTTNVSVGIENQDASDGLQVVFNADYLKDELAIQVNPGWITLSKFSGSIIAADTDTMDIEFDTTHLEVGTHNTNLVISSNDPAQPEAVLPITLEVNPAL
jgi:subtilisin family serine protease